MIECAGVYLNGYTPERFYMASETVRIKPETHAKLKAIADADGRSMPEVLEQAVEVLRRQRLLDATNEAYAKMKAIPKAWQTEQAERAAWEATLADGLEGGVR